MKSYIQYTVRFHILIWLAFWQKPGIFCNLLAIKGFGTLSRQVSFWALLSSYDHYYIIFWFIFHEGIWSSRCTVILFMFSTSQGALIKTIQNLLTCSSAKYHIHTESADISRFPYDNTFTGVLEGLRLS